MTISEQFNFQFDGTIFKHAFDADEALLALEIRNHDELQTSFATIDLKSGELLSHFALEEENWWLSIEALVHGELYIQRFKDDENPIREGLFCYNSHNGDFLWKKDQAKVIQWTKTSFFIEENEAQTELPLNKPVGSLALKYPQHYPQEHDYFSTVSSFLNNEQGISPVEALEYQESDSFIAISYYLYSSEKLENYLQVLTTEGELIFQDCLGTQLAGIGLNTFITFENQLIFVKNKNEIFSLTLPTSSDH